jgi:NAD+-dependent secondary alcohol dehydrogenase Adh1
MKAARLHNHDGNLNLDDVPEPKIEGPHDVVVRVGGAGLCRSDLHLIEGRELAGFPALDLPVTLGHETAGWVEAVGSSVTSVRPGDPVVAHPAMTCGVCPGCRRGEDLYCEQLGLPGLSSDGGFAEYLRTSERSLLRIDPRLEPADVAPFADAGLTVYRACRKAAATLPRGTRCAVVGVGGLGHIAIQCLRAMCPTEIIAVDVSEAARRLAEEVGADLVLEGGEGVVERIMAATGGQGVDAVVDLVGERGVPAQAPAMLRRGGTYYVVGIGETVSITTWDFASREISVVGTCIGNYADLTGMMALATDGKVTCSTRRYRLDDINEAIADLRDGRLTGRGVLVP